MIHDPRTCKLGKRTAVHPAGMRMMASVVDGLPTPPPAVAWYKGGRTATGAVLAPITSWPMDLNDSLSDCTIAAASHILQIWTNATGTMVVPTDNQVISAYSQACGYVQGNASTDQGGVESDVLTSWQTKGFFGHNIDSFLGINPTSQTQIKDAIWFFGAAYIGVELPISAQDQDVWDVPAGGAKGNGAPGSWGGHAVSIIGAGTRGITVVTWGATKTATWEFMSAYCSEAYAIISPDWVNSGIDPGGVPLASLQRDLGLVPKS